MSCTFDAAVIVVLPVLDVSSAITRGEALLTSAEEAANSPLIYLLMPEIVGRHRSRHCRL
jgi:hypothetical protein